jgi:AraC-like DNA-binding protein
MRFAGPGGDAADLLWEDIARPARPSRVPGVTMAGFRGRGAGDIELRALPNPAVMLVIEFGAGRLVVEDATGREQRGSLAAGLAPGAIRARAQGFQCVQVRLPPAVARAVLDIAPAELSSTVVTIEDLWGPDAARVEDQLRAAPTWEDRFGIVDAALGRRHDDGPLLCPEVDVAWRRITASRGRIRVEQLAGEVGWSRQRLWSRFRAQVGLTPKRAAKLVRFDHAAHRLATGESPAAVAAETGYADQSHLHREVRDFTRMTPSVVAGQPWLAVDGVAWPDSP